MRLTNVLSILMISTISATARADVQIFTKSLNDATHIELTGPTEWKYTITEDKKNRKIAVTFPNIAPATLEALLSLRDRRVTDVNINTAPNGGSVVEFATLSGAVKLFAYQTQDPIKLVFDFFVDELPAKKVAQKKKKKNPLDGLVARRIVKGKREPAGVESPTLGNQPALEQKSIPMGIFDGGDQDLSRFRLDDLDVNEEGLIRSSESIYVKMPELIVRHPYLEEIEKLEVNYDVPADKSEENKLYRLIVKLFNEKKPALVLRTIKFLREKYPVSKYDKNIEFLTADTYYQLWQRDQKRPDLDAALTRYKGHFTRYPDDPQRDRWVMLLGLNFHKMGNNFGVLSTFQSEVKEERRSPYYWQMRMAVADAYRALNRYDESLLEFDSINMDPTSNLFGIEAKYRKGDVYFRMKNYDAAIKEYKSAIAKYPNNLELAPNAFFNLAESYFQLKKYKEAIDAHREFLERFPAHKFGGYSMTRLGEIFEIVGAPTRKSMGAYLESIYRYRSTPGGYIAKRHLDLFKLPNMKEKEFEASLAELEESRPVDEIGDLNEFLTLYKGDAFTTRKQYDKGLDLYMNYYKTHSNSPYLEVFKKRIVKNYTLQITDLVSEGKSLDAVRVFLKNNLWLGKSDRVDLQYQVGSAYENLFLFDEAEKYFSAVKKIKESESPHGMKVRNVFETVPSDDLINLRLARVSLEKKKYADAGKYFAAIKSPEKLSPDRQVERSLLMARFAEEQERYNDAINFLSKLISEWKVDPDKNMEPWLKLARLSVKAKDNDKAIIWAEKVVKHADEKKPAHLSLVRDALEIIGDIRLAQGKSEGAMKAYRSLLEQYGENKEYPNIVYKIGKIYFDAKNFAEAQKSWGSLSKMQEGQMWNRLASEHLQQASWDQKYNKYMERSPAGGNP